MTSTRNEILLKETDKYKSFRIYKRLIMDKRTSKIIGYKIMNLVVMPEKNCFKLYTEKVKHRGKNVSQTTVQWRPESKSLVILPNKNKTGKITGVIGSHGRINKLSTVMVFCLGDKSQYVQRKINRVLKRELGFSVKIADPTNFNLMQMCFNKAVIRIVRDIVDAHFAKGFRADAIPKSVYNKTYTECLLLLYPYRKKLEKATGIKDILKALIGYKGSKLVKLVTADLSKFKALCLLSKYKTCFSHGLVNKCLEDYYTGALSFIDDYSATEKEMRFLLKKCPDSIVMASKRKTKAIDRSHIAITFRDTLSTIRRLKDLYDYEFQESDFDGGIYATHDRLSAVLRKQKHKNVDCPQYFPTLTQGNVSIRLPKNTHEILDWGVTQKHCIASYISSHMKGAEIVAGVYVNGKLEANLSLKKHIFNSVSFVTDQKEFKDFDYKKSPQYRLVQLLGACNQVVDEPLNQTVKNLLINNNIIEKEQHVRHIGQT